MKKWIMAIVCLMTMVMFTSCSNDDDIIKASSLRGKWITSDNVIWAFNNGVVSIYPKDNTNVKVKYYYESEGNTIIIHMMVETGGADAEYYKRKLNDLQEQLKTSRGSYKQYLIDEINRLTSEYREAKKNRRTEQVDVYGTILQLDSMMLVIKFNENKTYFRKI